MTTASPFDAPAAPAPPPGVPVGDPGAPGYAPPVAGVPAPGTAAPGYAMPAAPGYGSPIAGAPAGAPPLISPNRRRLDNRFPVLAFNVRTQGRPLFEVLLTTDRSLFDPANASRRTPANFYAGRQDGGLLHATAADTAYVVPAGVLKRFADARPRPGEIFYAAATYDAADGPPLLSQPVTTLALTAPSVLLGADFQANTLAAVLSVPADKLQPVGQAPGAPAPGAQPAHGGTELDDDGIPVGQAHSWSSEDDEENAMALAAEAWEADPHSMSLDAAPYEPELPAPAGAYADDPYDEPAAGAYADEPLDEPYEDPGEDYGESMADEEPYPEAESYASDDDDGYDSGYASEFGAEPDVPVPDVDAAGLDYDDGYGDSAAASHEQNGWAGAAESEYPPGSPEPAQLGDVEDDRLDSELAAAAAEEDFDEPYGTEAAYDDTAYDEAGYGALTNGNGAAPAPAPAAPAAPPAPVAGARPLDIPTKVGIVTKLGRKFESHGGYAGITPDSEFSNPRLQQYQRWHVGLSYGFIQFTQDSGMLGRLLQMMRERDPQAFRQIFGQDSDELVRVTTQRGPGSRTSPGGRSVRVQPVGGADLWTEPWLARFRAAGAHVPFQAAQNELAVRAFVDPTLSLAKGLGLDTERALAMVVDRAIQQGVGGARQWLIGAVGPIRTDAQRQQALGALGLPGLREFQQANGVRIDGEFGPITHAALVGALRRLGPASPVPIPTREQMMDAIVARADAEGVFWRRRPRAIRTDPDFADVQLTWVNPGGGH